MRFLRQGRPFGGREQRRLDDDLAAVLGIANLGVTTQVTHQDYLVDAASHRSAPFMMVNALG